MIISHEHKFIFIKTMKTAGTSIEIYLSQHCSDSDILTPIFPPNPKHQPRNFKPKKFFNHITALEVKNRVSSEVWDTYYKFCVERNPWDKTLSHYHMVRHRAGGELTLEEYFEKNIFCLNHQRYLGADGELIVDRVIKYEELLQGLSDVFSTISIPFSGDLGVKAKSNFRHDRSHYRDVLSERQVEILNEKFATEISLHNYIY